MSEMIEQVARAICRHQGFNPDEPGPQAQGERVLPYWQYVAPIARVAIEAMREPTAAMLDEDVVQVVVGCCGVRPEHSREVWQAMIDEALRALAQQQGQGHG